MEKKDIKEKIDMEKLIRNWYELNNSHPCDDRRFYDIVIQSIDTKIDLDTFIKALPDVNEEEVENIFMEYENYHDFLSYLKECGFFVKND